MCYSNNYLNINPQDSYVSPIKSKVACEQAVCLGKGWKNCEEREGKWKGATYFIVRGCERYGEIGLICPLIVMQEHSLQLKKLIS